jgi:serine/threonine protein kinase
VVRRRRERRAATGTGDRTRRDARCYSLAPPVSRDSTIEGRELGAYRLGRRLGAGGIGAVYAATHVRTGRAYAVKVLLPDAADDATSAARFRREAEALAAVGHSGIVAVHDFDVTDDGVAYLVMDKLEGEDLDARLARGPLSLAATQDLLHQVGSALATAHDAGILHRDLKPSNVFLARRPGMPERAVLLDFGLAKLMEGEHAKLTATGATMGTPMYMSPEQAQGLPVDRRTDVYALGAVLFECLTGRPPFDGPHVTAILAKVLTAPPPRLRDWNPDLPRGLDDVIVRALAKDPSERPASVPALVAAVNEALGDAPSDVAAPGAPRVVPPTQVTPMVVEVKRAEPSRRRRGLWIGAVTVLALVGSGLAWWATRAPNAPTIAPAIAPVPVRPTESSDASPASDTSEPTTESPNVRELETPSPSANAHANEPNENRPSTDAPTSATTRATSRTTSHAPSTSPPRDRSHVDLGSLGAAGVMQQLPRARLVLAREARGLELERPHTCAMPPDHAALRIMPGGAALAAEILASRSELCRTTPAVDADRRAHRALLARAEAHLARLEAAARR